MGESAPIITMSTRLLANPNLVLREEGDEGALLYDPDTGAVRVLNLTAAAIWKLLDAPRTLWEVVRALAEQFEGMDADADEQVLEMVRQLYRLGALGIVEGAL